VHKDIIVEGELNRPHKETEINKKISQANHLLTTKPCYETDTFRNQENFFCLAPLCRKTS